MAKPKQQQLPRPNSPYTVTTSSIISSTGSISSRSSLRRGSISSRSGNSLNISSSSQHDVPCSPRSPRTALAALDATTSTRSTRSTSSSSSPPSPDSVLEFYKNPNNNRSHRRRKRPINLHDPSMSPYNNNNNNNNNNADTIQKRPPEPPYLSSEDDDDDQTTSASSNNSNSNNKKKKTVRFHTRVKTRKHISRHNMTIKETYACWLSDRDYVMIERRNDRHIQKIEDSWETKNGKLRAAHNKHNLEGKTSGGSDLCSRGLENGLRSEYMTFEASKASAYKAVFREQDRFHDLNMALTDKADEAIARAYGKISKKSRFRAWNRALLDQKEAEAACDAACGEASSHHHRDAGDESMHSEEGSLRPQLRRQLEAVRSWVKAKHGSTKHHRKQ